LFHHHHYSFVITAYNDDDGTTPIARYISETDVSITGGTQSLGPFNLKGIVDGTDKGFFSYDITIVDDNYSNTNLIEIYKYEDLDNAEIEIPFDLPTTLNYADSAVELDSGYYIVKVTLSKDHYLTRQYTEALHIYPAMTSKMDDLVVPALVQSEFEVTFSLNGVTNTNSSYDGSSQWVAYGSTATKPSPSPTAVGKTFDDWYDSASGGAKWIFSTKVLATRPLWAHWVDNETQLEIDLEIDELASVTAGVSSSIKATGVSYLDGTQSVVITLGAPENGGSWDVNSIIWSIGGIDLSTNKTNTLTITNGGIYAPLFTLGNEVIDVSVTATKDSVPYSAKIQIAIDRTP